MMPASNNGVGMNIGFPDVCLTPPPPPVGPIPIPYPNFGLNAMSAVFSPNVFTGFMPALNMASIKPMTQGDNSGVLHPLFMQMGGQTMGNPTVLVNCIPAKHLLVPTFGNMFNNPVGATLVPSITVTLYTDRAAAPARGGAVDGATVRFLRSAVQGEASTPGGPVVESRELGGGRLYLALRRVPTDAARRIYNAVRRHQPAGVVLDLRGNPGGDTAACLELLDDLLPEGATLALWCERGEVTPHRARLPQQHAWPLLVLVDGGTASAAELLAGSLQAHGRARLIGAPTAGKGSGQRLCASPDGDGFSYESVAELRLPGGAPIHGVGLRPDLAVEPAAALEAALDLLPG